MVWLKCLATGSPLLLSQMLFVIVHTEFKDGRCFTYVVAHIYIYIYIYTK